MKSTLGVTLKHMPLSDGVLCERGMSERPVVVIEPDQKSRLVFLTDPAGLAVEQYKLLRRRLCAAHPNGGMMLVTSPNPGDGKTLTSVNLAWCLAEGGQETCLVDLDFRAPGIARTLSYKFEQGSLEDLLHGKHGMSNCLRKLGDRPLYVLGIRDRQVSPGNILGSPSLVALLKNLSTLFQWVVLDFAPVVPMADVAEMLPYVDGALMVIRSGRTERAIIAPSIELLGKKLWGVVLNDAVIQGSAYYGSYGGDKR